MSGSSKVHRVRSSRVRPVHDPLRRDDALRPVLGLLGQARGFVHRVADDGVLQALRRADVAGDHEALRNADTCIEFGHLGLQPPDHLAGSRQRRGGGIFSCSGAPKMHSAASPSNLFTSPPWVSTTSTTTSKNRLSAVTTSPATPGRGQRRAADDVDEQGRGLDLLTAELARRAPAPGARRPRRRVDRTGRAAAPARASRPPSG